MDYIDQYVFSLDLGVGGGVPIYGLTSNEDKPIVGGDGMASANERNRMLYVPGGLVCKYDMINMTSHCDEVNDDDDDLKLCEYSTIPNTVVLDELFDGLLKKMTVPVPPALRQKNKTQTNSVKVGRKHRRNKTVKKE